MKKTLIACCIVALVGCATKKETFHASTTHIVPFFLLYSLFKGYMGVCNMEYIPGFIGVNMIFYFWFELGARSLAKFDSRGDIFLRRSNIFEMVTKHALTKCMHHEKSVQE